MPIYSYRKAPIKLKPGEGVVNYDQYNSKRKSSKSITLADVLRGAYNDFHNLMTTSKLAALVIPSVLVITGSYILYNQVWDGFIQTVQMHTNYFERSGTPLVAGQYMEARTQYSNPGARYFEELRNSAQDKNLLFNDEKSLAYNRNFTLSIPSLGLNNIKTAANVDSSDQKEYDRMLTDGIAHFQGTNLPISDLDSQNIVIYGHSSAGDYYERTKDPAAAFSMLSQIRYGSEITLTMDGVDYTYRFVRGKIVEPDDLSILQGTPGQKTLTLFTCYPNGNNAKRFVATARLIE